MGFFEDDRIRCKNEIYNKAHKLYEEYRSKMMSSGDIISEIESRLSVNTENKVLYEVLKMAIRANAANSN